MKTILLKVMLMQIIVTIFQFAYFHHYALFFCVCLFLFQFGLFWSFFQANLVYFRETKMATLFRGVVLDCV